VELFVPGPLLPPSVADDLNNNLAGGIVWSIDSANQMLKNIAFILTHLPRMVSCHPSMPSVFNDKVWKDIQTTLKACKSGTYLLHSQVHKDAPADSERILSVSGNQSLITQDMVNMDQIAAFEKNKSTPAINKIQTHTLASNLASYFAPSERSYFRLKTALHQCWALRHLENAAEHWEPLPLDYTKVHSAHLGFQRTFANLGEASSDGSDPGGGITMLSQHFVGAMSALAYICGITDPMRPPKHSKLHEWSSKNTPRQIQMLAGLLVFGPTMAFNTNRSIHTPTSNSSALLQFGANVLKHKVNSGITFPMPHGTLDNLRLYFLEFLCRMGFSKIGDDGLPKVDWQKTHNKFHYHFATHHLVHLFSQDIEISLAHFSF
jgi:hypothetical protein